MKTTLFSHPRRSVALLGALLVLAAPAVTSCGFDEATDQVNTISEGVNDRAGNIDVLGAVVVASADGEGIFEATFANNTTIADASTESPSPAAVATAPNAVASPGTATAGDLPAGTDQLVGFAGGSAGKLQATKALPSIVIPPSGEVSTIDQQIGIPVTGSFTAGDFVTVDLTFASGQHTVMQVNVVRPCNQYYGLAPTPTATPFSLTTVDPDGGNTSAYSCDSESRPTSTPSE